MARSSALKQILIYDEGVRLRPYRDSLGNWTIGVGHYIGKDVEDLKLSEDVVMRILEEDLEKVELAALEIIGAFLFCDLTEARKDAVRSLIFNLGPAGFVGFRRTIDAIKEGRWDEAASELLNSKWARQVDLKNLSGRGRDDRIAEMLRTGEYPEAYRIKA